MMKNFHNLTSIKEESVYGFGPWVTRTKNEHEVSWEISLNDWYDVFNKAILDNVTDFGTAVQAGSWQGLYPFLLSNMFEEVYTFEPDPVNFYCTTLNCQRENIFKFQSALSDTCGSAIFEEVENTGQGRVVDEVNWEMRVERRKVVQTLTIDSMNLSDCGLIMLDVENHEYSALLGAKSTIKRCKPVIIAERSFIPDQNIMVEAYLYDLGYKIAKEFKTDTMFIYKAS